MKLTLHPEVIDSWPTPTPQAPWRALVSGCLVGWHCGVDGSDNGMGEALAALFRLPTLQRVPFCPEDHALGTPRGTPDLHGGDGLAVLAGTARARDERGADVTEAMLTGAKAMLAVAQQARVHFAILTDMSAACGSQVISDGCRFEQPRRYQRGVGVATALLLQSGIPVVSQRDHATLGRLRARLDPGFVPDPQALDHHRHPWVVANLPEPRR